jgi:hypothetical protein
MTRALYLVAIFPDETIPVRVSPDADPLSLSILIEEIDAAEGTFIYRTEDVETGQRLLCPSCRGHGATGAPWDPDTCQSCRGTGIVAEAAR